MLNNLYPTAPDAQKDALHAQLQAAIKCKGAAACNVYLGAGP